MSLSNENSSMKSRGRIVAIVVVAVLTIGIVAAAAYFFGRSSGTQPTAVTEATQGQVSPEETPSTSPQEEFDAREALFYPPERLGVMIASTISKSVQIECQGGYGAGWIYDTPYTPTYRKEDFEVAADGKDSLVITAKHVIDDCTGDPSTIKVLVDGQEVPSQLLNWHNKTDLATIAVDASIPGLEGSEDVKQGMWAMAIGWPFNYNLTPTIGRVIEVDGTDLFIDVLVEPGNSGGPLVDSNGEVIGTVTSSYLDDNDVTTGFNIATKTQALCRKLLSCTPLQSE